MLTRNDKQFIDNLVGQLSPVFMRHNGDTRVVTALLVAAVTIGLKENDIPPNPELVFAMAQDVEQYMRYRLSEIKQPAVVIERAPVSWWRRMLWGAKR